MIRAFAPTAPVKHNATVALLQNRRNPEKTDCSKCCSNKAAFRSAKNPGKLRLARGLLRACVMRASTPPTSLRDYGGRGVCANLRAHVTSDWAWADARPSLGKTGLRKLVRIMA